MSETIPVREGHRFDEARLGAWLEAQRFGVLESVTQFSGGQSNPTFLLKTSKGELVLRKQPPGKLLPSAHAVDREFLVLTVLEGAGLPVPKAYALCGDREVVGTPFFLMERMRGRVFRRNDLPELSREDRAPIYRAMAATMKQLHAIDPIARGLGNYGKTSGYYSRQVATWSRQVEAARTRETPALDQLVAWLPQNLAADDEVRISHGDFRIENLMFHESEPRVIAILDWELSTLGPPLADAGYNAGAWFMPPLPKVSGLAGLDLAALGIPSFREQFAGYDLKPFHVAFALFRVAAILEGVLARAKAGNASAADGEAFGKLGSVFADVAWRIARHGLEA